ncbi:hypothetical protein AB4Z45_27815 [Paenibacillus sp. MCAF9]|uniref:hypothetical protein n=1 Tax=Paenibacillus sp. MCAF9 TaxID=3233046 RepID=UPI003F96F088
MSDWSIYLFGVALCICGFFTIPRLVKTEENDELRVILKATQPIMKIGGIFVCVISLM